MARSTRTQERSVRTIRASAERLLRLVATVVDQARLDAGTFRLQQQWVAPHELIGEALGFARARAEGTSLIGGVSDGLPPVFVDRHRTVQALVSLTVLVIRSSETDVSIRVAPPRRDQSGKGFVQFDLMANLRDASADTLAVVEKLEKTSISVGCPRARGICGSKCHRDSGWANLDGGRHCGEPPRLHDAADLVVALVFFFESVQHRLVRRAPRPAVLALQTLAHFFRAETFAPPGRHELFEVDVFRTRRLRDALDDQCDLPLRRIGERRPDLR